MDPLRQRIFRTNADRFIAQDTWKGSPWLPWTQHLYVYVGNNPVNYVDPTGHKAVFFSGYSSVAKDQNVRAFLNALRARGVHDVSENGYRWSPGWGIATFVAEWLGTDRSFSQGIAKGLSKEFEGTREQGEQVNILGYSSGGVIAANVAVALVDSGVKVDNLVLIGAPVATETIRYLEEQGVRVSQVQSGCNDPVTSVEPSSGLVRLVRAAQADCHRATEYFGGNSRNSIADDLILRGLR